MMDMHSRALTVAPITGQAFKVCIRIIMSCQQGKIKSVLGR